MPAKKSDYKKEEKNTYPKTKLCRSETNRVIAGVCGGLGEYFNIDPTIIRIIFVLLTIFGGSGILIYIILWIVIPSESSLQTSQNHIKENVEEMKEKARTFAHEIRNPKNKEDSRFWMAILIIVLGFMFLFNNLGIFDFWQLRRLWPVILIILGLSLILRR